MTATTRATPTQSQHRTDPDWRVIASTRVQAETGCDPAVAERLLDFIGKLIARARERSSKSIHLRLEELESPDYALFDKVMTHGATARPGSAHEATERALLQGNEYSLTHGMDIKSGACELTIQSAA